MPSVTSNRSPKWSFAFCLHDLPQLDLLRCHSRLDYGSLPATIKGCYHIQCRANVSPPSTKAGQLQ